MITYRQLFAKAWQIAWKTPGLWLFALLAGFIGSAGEIELFFRSLTLGDSQSIIGEFFSGLAEGGLFSIKGMQGLVAAFLTKPIALVIIIIMLFAVIALMALAVWIVIVSQVALIWGVIKVVTKKKASMIESFAVGVSTFWPVFGLNLLIKAIIAGLFWLLGFVAIWQSPTTLYVFSGLFVVAIFIILIASFIIKYATFGVVLKKQTIAEALRASWGLFINNWLLSLEIAMIVFFAYWLVVDVALAAVIGLSFVNLVHFFEVAPWSLPLVVTGSLLVFIVVQALMTAFHWAVWAIVFELITSKKIVLTSRLNAAVGRIFRRSQS